jgi:threonyl-tRNA synthetase
MIRIRLPDGSERTVVRGIRLREAARTLQPELADLAVCAEVGGALRDLRDRLEEDCRMTLLTAAAPEGARVVRHTAAHVVAQAAKRLFPAATLGRDPIAENIFQYDLEIGRALTEDDLERIQVEVDRIIAEDLPIERDSLSKGEARTWLIRRGEVLKLEILERIDAPTVTVYSHGEFSDLCGGPHLQSTGRLPGIRLTSVEETTWQNDPGGERLLRFCGTFA